MPAKGAAVTVSYTAWNTSANQPKTGDAGNHTIKRIVDGAAAASITDTPTELENGEYEITLTAAENSGDAMSVEGSSSTGQVVIVPTKWMNADYSAIGATIAILPLQSTIDDSGRVSSNYLTAYQFAKIEATFSVVDSDDDPVDLSGVTLALTAWEKDTPATVVITLRSDGGSPELSVGGADDNQVTIDGSATHTAEAKQYDWELWDLDNERIVAVGTLTVEAGSAKPV